MKFRIAFLLVAVFLLFAGPNIVSYQMANAADKIMSVERQQSTTSSVNDGCSGGDPNAPELPHTTDVSNPDEYGNCGSGSGGSNDDYMPYIRCCGNDKVAVGGFCIECWDAAVTLGLFTSAGSHFFIGVFAGFSAYTLCTMMC